MLKVKYDPQLGPDRELETPQHMGALLLSRTELAQLIAGQFLEIDVSALVQTEYHAPIVLGFVPGMDDDEVRAMYEGITHADQR